MDRNEILVIGNNGYNFENDHILQLISKARSLADQCNMNVTLICAGQKKLLENELFKLYGVDTILFYEGDITEDIQTAKIIIYEMIASRNAKVVLFPSSEFGKAIASLMSVQFGAGLTADCIDVVIDNGEFVFIRAAINESFLVKIKCINCDINMGTIKEGVFVKSICDRGEDINVELFQRELPEMSHINRYQLLNEYREENIEEVDISRASTVFCIGRGVNSKEIIDRIYGLAALCDATVVCTRAIVEEKMISKEYQVGQSGKNISPNLYIGFGVSGASQHIVGVKNAKMIIAINNDPDAPIFSYADYSIVADVEDIITGLEEMMKFEFVV